MIKETQNQWLDKRYHAADSTLGIACPEFANVARAFGMPAEELASNEDLWIPSNLMKDQGPSLLEVHFDPHKTEFPITLYGKPIEDLSPYITPQQLKEEMIIPCLNN